MIHSLSGVNQTAIKLEIPESLIAQKICITRMREVDIAVFDANALHREILRKHAPRKFRCGTISCLNRTVNRE
jgi:hypothetical protein